MGLGRWDSATRREPYNDAEALAKTLPALNVEGFNGDTMPQVPRQFWDATLAEHAATGVPPLVFEPEGGGYGPEFGLPGLGSFDWDIAGWGYFHHAAMYPSGLHVYTARGWCPALGGWHGAVGFREPRSCAVAVQTRHLPMPHTQTQLHNTRGRRCLGSTRPSG